MFLAISDAAEQFFLRLRGLLGLRAVEALAIEASWPR